MGFKTLTHASKTNNFAAPLILVVEEDDDTRLMLKYLLEIWKYRVIEAVDDEEAMRLAVDFQPNLVLLNVKVQGSDALSNSRRMRALPALAHSEIVFVSDRTDEAVRASAFAEGIRDFLVKPINFGELEKILDQRLRRKIRLVKTPVREVF